jgi:mono/diheme cytochrome c family protein
MKAAIILALPLLLTACDDMTDQRRQNPYAAKTGSPPTPPAGTVAFAEKHVAPPAVTMALLQHGQEQFRVFCTPCHSELGDGHGIVVQRGFPAPPSYHSDRLRAASPQHFYDVIANGYGAMYSFAQRVPQSDRWAIVAYIRALQTSQHATTDQLTDAETSELAKDTPE